VAEGVGSHGGGRGSVLMLLTDVNRELGYVSEEAMREIAKASGVSTAEVQSVASFYSFISTVPRGRHIVRLCRTISCEMKGSAGVLAAIEKELGIQAGQTTPDGTVTLETTSCLGLCDKSPAMLVDDTPHSGLTPEKACEIVRGLRKGGKA
jgi:NADH:ubiquinone oxidoreductase subunit E